MRETELEAEKSRAQAWFSNLQESYCQRFERLEAGLWDSNSDSRPPVFESRKTSTRGEDGSDRGGGLMSVLRGGKLFEKVGVNASTVYGRLDKNSLQRLAAGKSVDGLECDPRFWASGISLVAHMRSPLVPAVHFNTRMFWTPAKLWFGGGADLNPCIEFPEDTEEFHGALRVCCDRTDPEYYPRFRSWADEYFFIRHRNRARGAGGIFFDELNSGDWESDFQFVTDIGRAFLKAYLPIVLRRRGLPWTEEDRETQLVHRGHYAEFNLVYDRGTKFGLESGHDPEAVLMSLPPLARWP